MRKKIFTFLLALATSVGLMWAQGPWTSGDCTLTLSGGVMTVSGNGAMANYGTSNPWKSYNSSITSIVIEDGVTHVGNGTFPQCTSLVSVVIGDDVETIGEFTFDDAGASLTSVTMGNKVKSIGMAAFLWDTGLSELILSEDLETIGDYAFCRMEALTTITIPSKVTSIGAAAFSNCSALQSIYIEAATPPTLGDGVFANVNANLSTIPLYVPSGSVDAYKAAAQWNAFNIQGYDPTPTPSGECGAQGDNLLWELNTSTGVLTITGSGAMNDWPDDTNLPWYDNRLQITSVVLPSGITSIGTKAFRGCQNLASINMTENYPAGLTVINQEAFCHTKLTSVTIPESVVTIGQDAFYRSEDITDVYCYADPNNLTWTDFWCDDFKNAKSTQCHVKDCYLEVYNSKWNTGTTSTDVNVTFVGDLPGDCSTPTPTPTPSGDNKLPGAFSVDDGKVVYFSKGNLQATTNDLGANWTWGFAANQYDYIDNAAANNAINGNGTVSTNGTIDLFGWSTSSTFYGIHNSNDNGTYYASFVDWSSNTALIASLGGDWRTLTSSEWGYLLDSRTTTSGVRYAKATVNGVAGLIILPDNWDVAYHALASTNNPDVDFNGNEISSAEWKNELEAHGAVFLPAAGNRNGTNVSEAGSAGYYWSATSFDAYTANYMYFNGSELSANSFNLLHYGRSVRLVSNIAPIPTSGSCGDNLTWEFNTETGALTISGTGAMTSAPWGTYKEDITSLSLPDGLTAIPSEAFKGCTGLTTVTIPASVTSIGADAFLGCESVTDVYCYPKAADLDWNDYYTDDFIEYPAAETRCHVYADEYLEYIARYSQGDGVNVTFMNDLEAIAVSTNEDPKNPAIYYSTFYHGTQKYRLPNDGTEAYVADLSGSDLRLTKIAEGNKVLPNGVAVILKAPSTNVTLFPTEAEPVTFTATNDLLGVDAETAAPANCYVLSGTTQDGVGFYRINSENLKAHKAYVIYTGSAAPKRMRFVFNQTTDVESIQPSAVSIQKILENGQVIIIRNGVRYNAAGQIVK